MYPDLGFQSPQHHYSQSNTNFDITSSPRAGLLLVVIAMDGMRLRTLVMSRICHCLIFHRMTPSVGINQDFSLILYLTSCPRFYTLENFAGLMIGDRLLPLKQGNTLGRDGSRHLVQTLAMAQLVSPQIIFGQCDSNIEKHTKQGFAICLLDL
jgi:hypothetical protein